MVIISGHSLSTILSVAGDLPLAQIAHAQALTNGLLYSHPLFVSKLITTYSRLGVPSLSRLVFDSSPLHLLSSPSLWNSLLAACIHNFLFLHPFPLFRRMCLHAPPDGFTLSILAKASASVSDLRTGSSIHSLIIRLGLDSDTVVLNSLMDFYFKNRCLFYARRVFDEMTVRSVASWNALISECVSWGDALGKEEVWKLVKLMQIDGLKPDGFTVSVVLPHCGGYPLGKEIHGFIVRNNLDLGSDFHVRSCLIGMYSRVGRVDIGRRIFDRMTAKNVVAWTSMIGGYVDNGVFEEAILLFRRMQLNGEMVPNKVTLVSVLPAVGSVASLMEGKQIHGFSIRTFSNSETSFNNALIDMYSKCGSLENARRVFDDISWHKDVISWSSMVSCYGIHGRGGEALDLLDEMCRYGIKLDHITSVGILSACVRSGLVSEGIKIYDSIVTNHGVCPTIEICSCVVNLLGRAGLLNQALDFIRLMPLAPGPSVWGALFDASVVHNNFKMQDLAFRFLVQLEPENASNFVSLSNLHASSGRWDSVAELRTRMKKKGIRKMPGCSWINVNDEVHSFCVADKSHKYTDIIYTVLDSLLMTMKGEIDVPTRNASLRNGQMWTRWCSHLYSFPKRRFRTCANERVATLSALCESSKRRETIWLMQLSIPFEGWFPTSRTPLLTRHSCLLYVAENCWATSSSFTSLQIRHYLGCLIQLRKLCLKFLARSPKKQAVTPTCMTVCSGHSTCGHCDHFTSSRMLSCLAEHYLCSH
ncbi:putative tetratricopeptide-like helical domain superfamily [Dioscorea sansibarensis]